MDVGDRLVQSVIRPVTREVTMPVEGKSDFSWSSYWATLISATVENAAPTHVVLTFPAAQSSLGASDFTIAGFTISSASWAGAVLTLVLSEAVLVFDGNLTVTFVTTGETATVTNNVADDGKTKGWYVIDDLSTITQDESHIVSVWKDKLGSGNDLVPLAAGWGPTYNAAGMQFRAAQALKKAFTYNRPATIYVVAKINATTNPKYICDGNADNSAGLFVNGPDLKFRININGSFTADVIASINNFHIFRINIPSTGNSSLQINETAAVTVASVGNVSGFTIGARAGGYAPINMDVFEIILRTSETNEAAVYSYLAKKLAFFLT